jgi:hypothetical protein
MLFEKLCTDEASFPNGYKYFVTKRNNDKRREIEAEKIRNALINQKNFEEEENRKFEIGFEKLWNNYSQNQPEIISALMAKAEELYKDDSDISNSLLKSMLIEQKAKDMAKEIYKNGKLTDLVGAVISEQKKLEKASIQTRLVTSNSIITLEGSSAVTM